MHEIMRRSCFRRWEKEQCEQDTERKKMEYVGDTSVMIGV